MGLKRTGEFRQDAVRIALTSGLTPKIQPQGLRAKLEGTWGTGHRIHTSFFPDDACVVGERIMHDNGAGESLEYEYGP